MSLYSVAGEIAEKECKGPASFRVLILNDFFFFIIDCIYRYII